MDSYSFGNEYFTLTFMVRVQLLTLFCFLNKGENTMTQMSAIDFVTLDLGFLWVNLSQILQVKKYSGRHEYGNRVLPASQPPVRLFHRISPLVIMSYDNQRHWFLFMGLYNLTILICHWPHCTISDEKESLHQRLDGRTSWTFAVIEQYLLGQSNLNMFLFHP